jgi:nucleoside-diphosphate-sugar epimerase
MNTRRVFLAGASGVVGIRLVPMLRDAGYEVFGTTRVASKGDALRHAGATPVIVDVFDASALAEQLASIRPSIVIHQLTDLPRALDPARMAEAIAANARLRREGTRHLIDAALAAGADRVIAQSIAWAYAPLPRPATEDDPLDIDATGARAITIGGVIALERAVTQSAPLDGVVLRYGRFYGRDTGVDVAPDAPAVHVDAAAHAALLAVQHARAGIFNIAEDSPVVSSGRARRELQWDPAFRSSAQ